MKTGKPARGVRQRAAERTRTNEALRQEITRRIQAEKALQESERRERQRAQELEVLFESVPLPVFIARDPKCRHLSGNQLANDILRVPPGDELSLSGPENTKPRHFRTFKNGKELSVEELPAQQAARGEQVKDYEFFLLFDDGTIRHVLGYATPLLDEQKHPRGSVAVLVDISERKQAEELLHSQSKHLEKLVQERTANLQAALSELEHFSYTITHDMRAPLRHMQCYGELLQADGVGLSQTGRSYVQRIRKAAHRMDLLITDALDYAKLSRFAFEIQPVDAKALLHGMIESYPHYQPPASQITVADDIPSVLANEAGLTQCFSNLLNNAIKFVEPGKQPQVRVWAQLRRVNGIFSGTTPETVTFVRFWIEDNGIGIPREFQGKIFGMFQQLNKEYEGTGIGLALVQKTAQRMQGRVGVESEPGKGSRFWMEFKMAT